MGFLELAYIIVTTSVLLGSLSASILFGIGAFNTLECEIDSDKPFCNFTNALFAKTKNVPEAKWVAFGGLTMMSILSIVYLFLVGLSIIGALSRKGHLLIPALLCGILEIFLSLAVMISISLAPFNTIFIDKAIDPLLLVIIVAICASFDVLRISLAFFVYIESKFAEHKVQVLPSRVPDEEFHKPNAVYPIEPQPLSYAC